MGRKSHSLNKTWRMLAKILQEKVVTETELIKLLGNDTKAVVSIKQSYRQFVSCGIPIRRKVLAAKWNRTGEGNRRINHRLVIYYVD